jgi:DNA-binding response OmpR family regulator
VNIHLGAFLLEIRNLFDELAQRRRIQFKVVCESAIDRVAIDVDKVEKILVNLLSNAFQHTPEGGRITLRLTATTPAEDSADPYYTLSVEDTGCGISQENIDAIFDKYFTARSDQPGLAGAGIGLSYIKDLVQILGGQIEVQSRLQAGTTFIVRLPYTPAAEHIPVATTESGTFHLARQEASLLLSSYLEDTPPPPESAGPPDADRPLVLVVEDNVDMTHFLTSILQPRYRVLTAPNGKAGLRLANDHSIDLIISDVMMPEMDGFAFCEQIKGTLTTSHIPVVLLTAKMLEENKLSGYRKGADDYITKPFSPELLRVRVANLLQQREKLREIFNREFMLTPKTEAISSPDEEFLQKLVDLMNDNLSEAEFNVEAMCQSMFLSHMHLIRKVKQLTGKKPVELLRSFRMKKAKDLLAQQKLTIAEVAYQVGFDLPNSFSRSFKKEFDLTPTQFLNSLPEPAPDYDMSDN